MNGNIEISHIDLIAITVFITDYLGNNIFLHSNYGIYNVCKMINNEYIKSDYKDLNDFLYFEEKERMIYLIKEKL